MARHQHHAADAGGCARAAGFRHAAHRKRGAFGRARELLEPFDRGKLVIDQVEIGKVVRQQALLGEAGVRVLGRDARHRDRALGKFGRVVALGVVAGDDSLPPADQHAQAEIVAFRALAPLDRAVAHLDRERDPAHRDGVGRVRARLAGGVDEAFGERDELRLVEKG